jgi:hypothetical protein
MNQRNKTVVRAAIVLVAIWGLAMAGWYISQHLKVTPEKVQAYISSVDFSKLSTAERAKAIQELADMLNKLSLEERQKLRAQRVVFAWFEQMTEDEKAQFLEATMPTGFKQMITAFEELPEEKRKRAIDDALHRLRATDDRVKAGQIATGDTSTNRPPPLSKDLEAKMRTIGLKTFYSQSSAQTKAELAPVLEELQRVMESGRMIRAPRQ